ncbi:inovirus Gp2 family protein [Escherichia coli]|uniref:inovirus Gp2 family protein n=1 Tax=Escherichia coli TaxID=562 RepID=UPI000390B117|nr:inovirus Gp2 family protein [Escherichia coli]EFF0685543.1 inovirus Gp2 family protein [Escherichia coli]EFH4666396.1 inovirus-type Gp2 protein [Escherichia coli]EGY1224497.1 inovirus Gp2 family protein [Escherichia coli]EHO1961684.1 inovirus Gp2 family protein [Escherichia coli]EHU7424343.1 inovirus Gp2 family protein [Escherichia coli]
MKTFISPFGLSNQHHMDRIRETLDKSLQEYPRTFVLNIILRLPDENYEHYKADPKLITRFIESLKSQIEHTQKRKAAQGKRIRSCNVRYAWSREFGEEKGKKHYHVALMLNKDVYCNAGTYSLNNKQYVHNLALMIMEAWIRTLSLNVTSDYQKHYTLVHFVKEGDFRLDKNGENFEYYYSQLERSLSYLTKLATKDSSDGMRNFGCSQS